MRQRVKIQSSSSCLFKCFCTYCRSVRPILLQTTGNATLAIVVFSSRKLAIGEAIQRKIISTSFTSCNDYCCEITYIARFVWLRPWRDVVEVDRVHYTIAAAYVVVTTMAIFQFLIIVHIFLHM